MSPAFRSHSYHLRSPSESISESVRRVREGTHALCLAAILMSNPGCAEQATSTSTGPATATSTGSTPRIASGAPAAAAMGPLVEIDTAQVKVDDKPIANAKALEDSGRIQKIDELFEAMKAARTKWKASDKEPFAGVYTLRVQPELTMVTLKSAVGTAGFAGFAHASVQLQGTTSAIYELDWGWDPNDPDMPRPDTPPPWKSGDKVCHIRLAKDGTVGMIWREEGPSFSQKPPLSERTLELQTPDLSKAIREEWTKLGMHREPSDPGFDRAAVHTENNVTVTELARLLDAIGTVRRDRGAKNETASGPVFQIAVSLN